MMSSVPAPARNHIMTNGLRHGLIVFDVLLANYAVTDVVIEARSRIASTGSLCKRRQAKKSIHEKKTSLSSRARLTIKSYRRL
jgi:hypothetical protein